MFCLLKTSQWLSVFRTSALFVVPNTVGNGRFGQANILLAGKKADHKNYKIYR